MGSTDGKYDKVEFSGKDGELQKVILHQRHQVEEIRQSSSETTEQAEDAIASSEKLLQSLGKSLPVLHHSTPTSKVQPLLRSWEELSNEAQQSISGEVAIADLLSTGDIAKVEGRILLLRNQFDLQHKLDMLDYGIAGIAGTLAALVDIFLVKMPSSRGILGSPGTKGGSLSDFFRNHLKNQFSPDEIRKLERDNWVPYDASTSRNLGEEVAGLGPLSHRFHSLGHDPILGFLFGVKDIMCGSMTTIDSFGKVVSQSIPGSSPGLTLFEALIRQLGHLKSDIGTSAGLPAPFMPLLGLLQFGSIGDRDRTIGRLARSMYAKGYDFGHFIAMSIPVLMIEVLVRTFYFLKRIHEGHGLVESLPFNLPGQPRKPKLQTMLFTAHAIATAANAGKIAFTQNPLATNVPQWLWFAKSAIQQLKWVAWEKENERLAHVQSQLDTDWEEVNSRLLGEWSLLEAPIQLH